MKKRILILLLLILSSIALTSCTNSNSIELIYDKQNELVAIDDFNLSDIILYNNSDGTIIFVSEDMLNAEDLNKTKIPGQHVIKINYNDHIYECKINLINYITYEVKYKNGNMPVLLSDFRISDLEIIIDRDGEIKKETVTESMLSASDLDKLQNVGTHNIVVSYNNVYIETIVILKDVEKEYEYSIYNPYKNGTNIDDFELRNIKLEIKEKGSEDNSFYVDVVESMLSSSDLNKLDTVGTHQITIRYNNFSETIEIHLFKEEIEDTIYDIVNPYQGKETKISDFKLSYIIIEETINGKTSSYPVTSSMLSVSDYNKLSTIGKHTITITYKTYVVSVEISLVEDKQEDNGGNNNNNINNIANGYYASTIGLSGNQLKLALRTIINSGTKDTTYDDLRTALAKTDPGKSSGKIFLFYQRRDVNAAWDGGKTWNREHVWPQSQGWFKTSGAGSDIHHIRPTDPGENSRRGNTRYGVGSGYYEPKNEVKGDVARIIFYLLTRYSQTDSSYPVTKVAASMSMLLDWHEMDPVDSIEKYRNEEAYKIQKNRNPFIDIPEYAYQIWDTSRLSNQNKQNSVIVIEINIVAYFENKKEEYFV